MIKFYDYGEMREYLRDTRCACLEYGDVGVQGGTALISRLIRGFRGSDINHAWLYDSGGECIEAQWSGVKKANMIDRIKPGNAIRIYRMAGLSFQERFDLVAVAREFIGKQYGVSELISQAPDSLLQKIPGLSHLQLFSRWQRRNRFICSEVVARAYWEIEEYFFGVGTKPKGNWDVCNTTPDEIDLRCGHSVKWNGVLRVLASWEPAVFDMGMRVVGVIC